MNSRGIESGKNLSALKGYPFKIFKNGKRDQLVTIFFDIKQNDNKITKDNPEEDKENLIQKVGL